MAAALEALDTGDYGQVLRAKGIVAGTDGKWLHFDYVPGEVEIRNGAAGVTGRLCVIGAELKEDKLAEGGRLDFAVPPELKNGGLTNGKSC